MTQRLPNFTVLMLFSISLILLTSSEGLYAESKAPKDSTEETSSFSWVNTKAPAAPLMENPVVITSLAQLEKHKLMNPTNPNPVPSGESPLYPAGYIYYLGPATNISASTDVIIDFRKETHVISKPIRTWHARNVHLIGLKMKLAAPKEGGVKKLKNFDGNSFIQFSNPYPRVPGGAAIGISHSHVLYIEGCDIDCNGNNIDAIVPSPNNSQSHADQLTYRKIVIINSRIRGFVGHNVIKGVGEGLHCDAVQIQSGTVGEIVLENVDMETGHEGLALNTVTDPSSPAFAPAPGSLTINNVSYDIDTRFIDKNPKMHQYPVALGTNVLLKNLKISNFEYRRLQGCNAETGVPYNGPHAILYADLYNESLSKYKYTYFVDPKHADNNLKALSGLKLIEGTVADNNLLANPMTKYAPKQYLGTGYKPDKPLYK